MRSDSKGSSPRGARLPGCLVFSIVLLAACAANPPDTEGGSGGTSGGSGGTSGSASGGTKGSGGSTASGSGGSAAGTGGSSGGAATCTPGKVAPTAALVTAYDSVALNVPAPDGHQYYVQVNEWNSTAPQTVQVGGDFFFKVTVQQASVATTGAPTWCSWISK